MIYFYCNYVYNHFRKYIYSIEKASAISGINFKTVKPRVDTWNKLSRKSVRIESIAPSNAIPTSTQTSAVTNRISVLTTKQTIKLVKTSTHQTAKLEAATKITIPSKGIHIKKIKNNIHHTVHIIKAK